MNIRPGDIIIFRLNKTKTKKANFIKKIWHGLLMFFQNSITHTALYYGKNEEGEHQLIEAYEGHGIRKRVFNINDPDIKICGIKKGKKITNKIRTAKIILFFNRTNTYDYSKRDWFNAMVSAVTKKIKNEYEYPLHDDKNGFICSEYCRVHWKEDHNIDLTPGLKIPTPLAFNKNKELFVKKKFGEVWKYDN